MARYMQVASELRKEVESFVNVFVKGEPLTHEVAGQPVAIDPQDRVNEAARQLGYIINLAVRCAPRAVQSTVRKNIVQEAVGRYCDVTMTQEEDKVTGRTYNKIHITSK